MLDVLVVPRAERQIQRAPIPARGVELDGDAGPLQARRRAPRCHARHVEMAEPSPAPVVQIIGVMPVALEEEPGPAGRIVTDQRPALDLVLAGNVEIVVHDVSVTKQVEAPVVDTVVHLGAALVVEVAELELLVPDIPL